MPQILSSPNSSDELVSEREALEELIGTEGWRVFLRFARQEWKGEGYVARMGRALGTGDVSDARAVHMTNQEIDRLVNWPAYRVRELKGVVEQ